MFAFFYNLSLTGWLRFIPIICIMWRQRRWLTEKRSLFLVYCLCQSWCSSSSHIQKYNLHFQRIGESNQTLNTAVLSISCLSLLFIFDKWRKKTWLFEQENLEFLYIFTGPKNKINELSLTICTKARGITKSVELDVFTTLGTFDLFLMDSCAAIIFVTDFYKWTMLVKV